MYIKKITSFTIHQTAEGLRATFTYSIIAEDGTIIKSNARATVILLDQAILSEAADIQNFLIGKIPE